MTSLELLMNINALILTIVNPQKILALDDIKDKETQKQKNEWKL